MVEDIVLVRFPKESGIYLFKANDEVIYVGSSKNLHKRMTQHRSSIRKGGNNNGASKQELYQYLQSNPFTVEFQTTEDYRQLEQKLIEQYNPKYNNLRAYTGVAWNGNRAEYDKEHYQKYKEEKKQYREKNKEQKKQYDNQLCLYNGQTLTLCALRERFKRAGIPHPTIEAKKYLIEESKTPIEFYDVYP